MQTDEIKRLKKVLKDWQSKEVSERFEQVNSQLHIVVIEDLKQKLKKLKKSKAI